RLENQTGEPVTRLENQTGEKRVRNGGETGEKRVSQSPTPVTVYRLSPKTEKDQFGDVSARVLSHRSIYQDPDGPTDDPPYSPPTKRGDRADERKFQKQFRKLPTELQVWIKNRILARAKGPVRARHAYLRASLPGFVENLQQEIAEYLIEET